MLLIAGSWLAEYDMPFRRFVRVLGVADISLLRCERISCLLASLREMTLPDEDDDDDLVDVALDLLPAILLFSFLVGFALLVLFLSLSTASVSIFPSLL